MKNITLAAAEIKAIQEGKQKCLFLPVVFPYFVHHFSNGVPICHKYKAKRVTMALNENSPSYPENIVNISDLLAVCDNDTTVATLCVTDVSCKPVQNITVEDILDFGLNVEMPPICKQQTDLNWPSDEQRAIFNKLSEKEKENYIHSRARATYIGWCEYADNLLAAFRKTWNQTIDRQHSMFLNYDANPYVWHIKFEKTNEETKSCM